jgi:hypothetical protein
MRRSPIMPLAAATTAMLALSACTADEPAKEDQSAEETKVDLVELLNENDRLFKELYEIEPDITRVCLEDAGFTVHDEMALYQVEVIGVDEGGLQEDYYSFSEWLPDPDLAAQWGFGQWVYQADDSGDLVTEYNELRYPEEPTTVEEDYPDNSAFEALDAEEQIAWYTAFMGEEQMTYNDVAWQLRNPDASQEEVSQRLSEIQHVEDDGSIEGDLELIPPKPGGCELATIEALYGEPQLVEEEMEEGVEEGLAIFTWKFRPEEPAIPPTDQAAIEAATAEVSAAFLSCVAEAGYGEWEFQEGGWLPVSEYFYQIYLDEEYEEVYEEGFEPPEVTIPDLPADLPDDFEGRKAYEIEMAVAFSGCADEVQYRETVIAAMDAEELAAYEAIEIDLFAYQDQLREALKTAQDLLEA